MSTTSNNFTTIFDNPPLPDPLPPQPFPTPQPLPMQPQPIPLPQPFPQPIPFPIKSLRCGCYLVNYKPNGSPLVRYDGTIRVECHSNGRTASGDLYQRGIIFLPPQKSADSAFSGVDSFAGAKSGVRHPDSTAQPLSLLSADNPVAGEFYLRQ